MTESKRSIAERLKLDKVKQAILEKMEDQHDNETARTRARWMDRWAKISNCPILENGRYDYSKIDWENKYVKLEYWMCDLRILAKLGDEKTRAAGVMLLPEDVRPVYLYETGPDNSKPYSEVYLGMSQIKHGIKQARKKK